jgi:hypothetical protein
VLAACALGAVSCKHRDQDSKRRFEWIREQTAANKLYVRDVLTRTGYYEFYDGWYPPENDPKSNNAWRWMDKRGIVRMRTTIGEDKTPRDMELKIFGWVPQEHVGFRKIILEFSVNGHVLGRFDPPKGSFEHTIFVPRWLLEHGDWVDFVITASNTARPNGDWRDLGFATTGFHWTPVGGS